MLVKTKKAKQKFCSLIDHKNTIPMLCKDKVTAIFCIIDDILKEIEHPEDKRRKISNSQIITTAIISATSFYGNYSSAIKFVKQYGLITNTLWRMIIQIMV